MLSRVTWANEDITSQFRTDLYCLVYTRTSDMRSDYRKARLLRRHPPLGLFHSHPKGNDFFVLGYREIRPRYRFLTPLGDALERPPRIRLCRRVCVDRVDLAVREEERETRCAVQISSAESCRLSDMPTEAAVF